MVVGSCFAVARGILPISEPGMPRDAKSDSSGQLVDVDCVHGVNGRFRLPMVPMVKNESVDTETPRQRDSEVARSLGSQECRGLVRVCGTCSRHRTWQLCTLCVTFNALEGTMGTSECVNLNHVFRGKQPVEGLVLHDQHFDAKKVLGTWLCCVANLNRRTSLECGNAKLVLIWRIYPWQHSCDFCDLQWQILSIQCEGPGCLSVALKQQTATCESKSCLVWSG